MMFGKGGNGSVFGSDAVGVDIESIAMMGIDGGSGDDSKQPAQQFGAGGAAGTGGAGGIGGQNIGNQPPGLGGGGSLRGLGSLNTTNNQHHGGMQGWGR